MKSEVYERKMDTRDELLPRILDAVAGRKKGEDQLRRATRDIHKRVAKCSEFNGGVFENLFRSVTDLSFPCIKIVREKLN